jgi:hypothetical protein
MRREFWLAPLLAIGALVVNVIVSIGVVWVYSTFIETGHNMAFYEAWAQSAAPVSSVVAGIPIMFAAAWMAARACAPRGFAAGVAVAVTYLVIDTAAIVATGALGSLGMLVAVSYVTKLGAAALGAWLGSRRSA